MSSPKIKFNNKESIDFITELRLRIDSYFKDNNLSQYANMRMVIKTIALFILTFGAYGMILSNQFNVWTMLFLAILMGIGIAGIGFSVQHDANHGAYSSNSTVNTILGFSLNLIGGNAFTWKIQHNILHHTYTNIYNMDEDLDAGIIIRLSENAPHKSYHKYQHYFAFFAYSLVTLSWLFVKDFKKIQRYSGNSTSGYQKKLPLYEYLILLASKLVYVSYMIVLPLVLLDITWWQFLVGFLTMHFTTGVILSVTFQLGHLVEGVDQPFPENNSIENSWAVHQLNTTSNFAMKNNYLSWYMGGLNYQVEHHLFPKICSIHYPEISKIIQVVAKKYNHPYHSQETFYEALKSHYLILKKFGQSAI